MNIVIKDKGGAYWVSYSRADKPSGGATICIKTKDKTIYFPLDTDVGTRHRLRVKHKGKEYGVWCKFILP